MIERPTFAEMYEDYCTFACPLIARIVNESIPRFWNGKWIPNPSRSGEFVPKGWATRCRIRFKPLHFIKSDKVTGEGVPVGQQKAVQAVLLDRSARLPAGYDRLVMVEMGDDETLRLLALGEPAPPDSRPATLVDVLEHNDDYVERSYEVGETWEHVSTESEKKGWNVEATLSSETTIGNDSTPAKQVITASVTSGRFGEKESGSSYGQTKSTLNTTTDHIEIPLGYRTKVEQTQRTGEIEFPVVHSFVMDLCFEVSGYKDRSSEGRFRDGPDHNWSAKKSKFILKVKSEEDFRRIMHGTERRYPHVDNILDRNRIVRQAYYALMDQGQRTSVIRKRERYKNGFFDHGERSYEPL